MASEPPSQQHHRAEEEDGREEQKQPQEESPEEEEEYIDIDVGSSAFLYYTFAASSPPLLDDPFEFHLSLHHPHHDAVAGASPADELFYKGKLLPLHLPPRLQMLQKLLLDDCRDHSPPPPSSSSWRSHPPHEAPPQGKPGSAKGHYRSRLVRATRRCLASVFGRRRAGDGARVEERRRSVSGVICRYLPVANYAPSSGSASVHSESSRSTAAPRGDGGGRRDGDEEEEEESSIQRAIAYCKSSLRSPTATNVVDSRTGAADVRVAKTSEQC